MSQRKASKAKNPKASKTSKAPEVGFSKEEANYFLQILDMYRETVKALYTNIAPTDSLVVMAFMQAAIEVQMPGAEDAFEDVREFFRTIYPMVMKSHLEQHPDDVAPEGDLLIIVPRPIVDGPSVCALTDEPKMIVEPGKSIH